MLHLQENMFSKKFKLEDQQVELEGEFYVDITGVCIITNLQNSTIT